MGQTRHRVIARAHGRAHATGHQRSVRSGASAPCAAPLCLRSAGRLFRPCRAARRPRRRDARRRLSPQRRRGGSAQPPGPYSAPPAFLESFCRRRRQTIKRPCLEIQPRCLLPPSLQQAMAAPLPVAGRTGPRTSAAGEESSAVAGGEATEACLRAGLGPSPCRFFPLPPCHARQTCLCACV